MPSLESLQAELNSVRSYLAQKEAEKSNYSHMASTIKGVYNRMLEDKKIVKGYRDSVNEFRKEKFETFKGNLYKESYEPQIENLVDNYNFVISNIDINLDRLNERVAFYEGKAYECNILIGQYQSSINYLVHKIENWTN